MLVLVLPAPCNSNGTGIKPSHVVRPSVRPSVCSAYNVEVRWSYKLDYPSNLGAVEVGMGLRPEMRVCCY